MTARDKPSESIPTTNEVVDTTRPTEPDVGGTLRLRRAQAEDHDLLMQLIGEFYVVDQHRFEPEHVASALMPLINHDQFGIIFLLERAVATPESLHSTARRKRPLSLQIPRDQGESQTLGYCVLTWGYSIESGGREALIDEIYLRERGQGIGSALMPAIMDALRELGIVKVFLETETHNKRARRFYQANGFVSDDSIWMSLTL